MVIARAFPNFPPTAYLVLTRLPKLTKRTIDATNPKPNGDVFVWDDEIPGFGLRVKPSGAKSFLAQYRNANGRSRRITLGRFGILTAEEGRQRVKFLLAQVLQGQDPAAARSADRSAMTVADLCREYLERSAKGLILTRRKAAKKPSTLYTDRGRIERHVIPLLGNRTVKDLTAADLRGFIRDVIAGKTNVDVKTKARGRAIVRGGKGTATRTMALFSSVLTYAVGEGYRPDNPARGITLPSYRRRKVRLDTAQYRALGLALEEAEARGETWQSVAAIRLITLTGCRRSEITSLLKTEIDLGGSLLRLSDTKTGASLRPIGKGAIALIRDAQRRSNSLYLLPAIRKVDAPYTGLPKVWTRIAKSVLPGATLHTLRHSFASVADDLGFTEATIGAMLGHSGGGTTRKYVHKLDGALLAAADKVARAIGSMMSGADAEIGGGQLDGAQ